MSRRDGMIAWAVTIVVVALLLRNDRVFQRSRRRMKCPTSINEPGTPAFEEVTGAVKPSITALAPASCAIGDADSDLHVTGEGLRRAQHDLFRRPRTRPTTA